MATISGDGGITRVTAGMVNGAGNYAELTMHYFDISTVTAVAYEYAKGLLSAFVTANVPPLKACLGHDVFINLITARVIFPNVGNPYASTPINEQGGDTEDSVSQALAAMIRFPTNPTAGGPRQGRIFVPGIAQDVIDGDIIGDPLLGHLDTLATALETNLNFLIGVDAHTAQPCIYRARVPDYNIIADHEIDNHVHTLRRRYAPRV